MKATKKMKYASKCMTMEFLQGLLKRDGLGPDGKSDYCLESVKEAIFEKQEIDTKKKEKRMREQDQAQKSLKELVAVLKREGTMFLTEDTLQIVCRELKPIVNRVALPF